MASVDEEMAAIIATLQLQAHPAGGHFVETFRSTRSVQPLSQENDPSCLAHSGSRSAGTAVYYLLPKGKNVKWHMHKSDEIFIYLKGCPTKVHLLTQDGQLNTCILGDPMVTPGASYHVPVTYGTWYALELTDPSKFVLYTAVVTPGFEFEDWIEGKKEDMLTKFPQHKEIIDRLT